MKIYDFNGKKNISGERIREARIKMHLSQKALAVRLKLEGVELERKKNTSTQTPTFVIFQKINLRQKTCIKKLKFHQISKPWNSK